MTKRQCEKRVHDTGRGVSFHQCTRAGILEYEGYWYCKTHHEPTQKAMKAVIPVCQFRYGRDKGTCSTRLTGNDASDAMKYCRLHRHSVFTDILWTKAKQFDRIVAAYKRGDIGLPPEIEKLLKYKVRNT